MWQLHVFSQLEQSEHLCLNVAFEDENNSFELRKDISVDLQPAWDGYSLRVLDSVYSKGYLHYGDFVDSGNSVVGSWR
jgi:hypothetical protein